MFVLSGFTLLVLGALQLTAAQDLGVPLSWRHFSNLRSLATRIAISRNAINTILPQLTPSDAQFNGIGWWQSGNVWSAIANHDYHAKTRTYQTQVIDNIKKGWSLYTNFDPYEYNDDALWWATAALYAHRAYDGSTMLTYAIDTWTHVSKYVISEADAASGRISTKSFAIAKTCSGHTMAGGVFWRPISGDTSINSITTGLYMTLSAYLAEYTGEAKYTEAAILSAQWIKNVNLNSKHIALDFINADDCSRSPSSWLFTYNTGKFVEGLSVLTSVTKDSSWKDLMTLVVANATKSSAWEGSDGIITEGSSTESGNDGVGFKAIFIRGLGEAFVRNTEYSHFAILIQSYIDVQCNALLELAASGTSYSANWHGPPMAFTTWGQMAALDVLVSAIPGY
ncbi:endo-1,6-alpha-mannosidase [Amanita rubescens]|nr:endo-1,6-alpha-mannosidase [Amanita rubescens]